MGSTWKRFTNWVSDDLLGINPGPSTDQLAQQQANAAAQQQQLQQQLAAERAAAAAQQSAAQVSLDSALAASKAALQSAQDASAIPADSESAQLAREQKLRRALARRPPVDAGSLGAATSGTKMLLGA